jgi:hypothetical protein
VRDRKPIAPERVARGSTFCSDDCRSADKRERRAVKAGTSCRLCGRRFTRARRQSAKVAEPELFNAGATGAQQAADEGQTGETVGEGTQG